MCLNPNWGSSAPWESFGVWFICISAEVVYPTCFAGHVFSHENILVIGRVAETQVIQELTGARHSPEASLAVDRLDEVRSHLGVVTRQSSENGVLSASWLACPPIHIEVSMSVWSPLAQNARTCVYHIYKVGVRRVKVMGPVVPHEEQDCGIQPSDPSEFAFVEKVGNKPCNVGSDAVANQVQGIWRNATGMVGEVIHQLGDALRPEPRSPIDLAEARFLDYSGVVHDDDIVITTCEVGVSEICARR